MRFLLYTSLIIGLFGCNSGDLTFQLKEPGSEEQLGELLFFDPILSSDSSISCASCHKPEFAFADNAKISKGVDGKTGNRIHLLSR